MKVFLVSESYDADPIICLTLEVAQRVASEIRTKEFEHDRSDRFTNVFWERQESRYEGTIEAWYLYGDWTLKDGVNEPGRRYMVGPDVVIYEGEVLEA